MAIGRKWALPLSRFLEYFPRNVYNITIGSYTSTKLSSLSTKCVPWWIAHNRKELVTRQDAWLPGYMFTGHKPFRWNPKDCSEGFMTWRIDPWTDNQWVLFPLGMVTGRLRAFQTFWYRSRISLWESRCESSRESTHLIELEAHWERLRFQPDFVTNRGRNALDSAQPYCLCITEKLPDSVVDPHNVGSLLQPETCVGCGVEGTVKKWGSSFKKIQSSRSI